MQDRLLFLDIETTGLVDRGLSWEKDFLKFPYIVAIGWNVVQAETDVFNSEIIKPLGYEIPKESTAIHGISNDKALKHGTGFVNAWPPVLKEALLADKIIGHNLYFDTSIIKANILRSLHENIDYYGGFIKEAVNIALHKNKRIDTMQKTISFVGAKMKDSNRLKYPTLLELHLKLFEKKFDAHNVEADVLAVKNCYFKLVELGVL